jgi:hypothetical protein
MHTVRKLSQQGQETILAVSENHLRSDRKPSQQCQDTILSVSGNYLSSVRKSSFQCPENISAVSGNHLTCFIDTAEKSIISVMVVATVSVLTARR